MYPRFYLLFLFVFALATDCIAQRVAIQNLKENFIYSGVPNPLRVAAEGVCMCDTRVTTDNGVIKREESCNEYTIYPQHPGRATIKVEEHKYGQWKVIDSQHFRVRLLPVDVFFVGKRGGTITKSELCSGIALAAPIMCCGFDAKFKIIQHSVSVKRKNKTFYYKMLSNANYGVRIDDDSTNDFFRTTKNGDSVIFDSIKAVGPSGEIREFDALKFTVIEAEKYNPPTTVARDRELVIDPITGEEMMRPVRKRPFTGKKK